MTAVKDHQKPLREDLRTTVWEASANVHQTLDQGHGRTESWHGTMVDVSGPQWDGPCRLPGRRQAFWIQHLRTDTKTGKRAEECADGLTSLAAEQADAGDLNALVRNHGSMENRRHSVQDFTDDEDRCRVKTRHTPRNLSALIHDRTRPPRFQIGTGPVRPPGTAAPASG